MKTAELEKLKEDGDPTLRPLSAIGEIAKLCKMESIWSSNLPKVIANQERPSEGILINVGAKPYEGSTTFVRLFE